MLPPNYSEPPNICTTCGKQWEGNPYEYETDNHEFPCPKCAAQQIVQPTPESGRDMPVESNNSEGSAPAKSG